MFYVSHALKKARSILRQSLRAFLTDTSQSDDQNKATGYQSEREFHYCPQAKQFARNVRTRASLEHQLISQGSFPFVFLV